MLTNTERKEKMEKQNELLTRADEMVESAKTENRELTPDEMQELAEIRDDVKKIKEFLDIDDDLREIEKEKDGNVPEEEMNMNEEKRALTDEELEVRAFDAYIRGEVLNERVNNLEKGTNGAVIPTSIANRIIKRVYDISPVLERSSKYNVKGNLVLPYYDETTTAITVAYQTEFTAMQSNVGGFQSITLTGFLAGALAKVSRSLINNSEFNLVDWLVDEMAYKIKVFIEGELLKGTTNKVAGLSGLTNSVTAGSASALTVDDIINVHDAIKDDFQQDAIWVMSPATRTALRKLKSTTGYPLLNDDISSPFGTTLLGKPVYVSDNMDNIATGKTVIYYGDMRGLATKFAEDINIQVLREKYADEHADGIIAWFEFDSKVEDAQKIAKLVMA
jgi:HK97 family phage major capsid protein